MTYKEPSCSILDALCMQFWGMQRGSAWCGAGGHGTDQPSALEFPLLLLGAQLCTAGLWKDRRCAY